MDNSISSKMGQVKPDQVKPDQVKPDQVKPDQVKPDQVKPDQVKPDQVKPDQVKPDQEKLVSETSTHNKLYDNWCLWGHLPHDIDWTLKSYKQITTLETIEQTIALYETLPEKMINNCMLFLMRKGINPMWEDPKNHKGGCFSYKINNKNVASVWKNLSYTLVGETLTEERNIRANINGITISPKKNFCIIKIWLATCEYQNPKTIGEIAGGITAQGCLFKKHM